jgi:tetratricopeptide (TPR) repeat protein
MRVERLVGITRLLLSFLVIVSSWSITVAQERQQVLDAIIEKDPSGPAESIEQQNRESAKNQLNLALSLLDKKQYRSAADILELATASDDSSGDIWNFLGISYYKLAEFELAVRCYKHMLEIPVESVLVYNNLGYVYLALRRFTEAASVFNKALALTPRFPASTSGLCVAYSATEEFEQQALEYCRAATELSPDSAAAYYLLGYSYLRSHQAENALKAFNKALEIDSPTARNYIGIGHAQSMLGRYSEALQSFERARSLRSDSVESIVGMGAVYYRMGKYELANQAFERALEIDPDSREGRYNLAITCLTQNHRDCAMREYNYLKIANSPLAEVLFEQLFQNRVVDARSSRITK